MKWQDGKQVTCDDFKYGVSRTFATDVITGGPTYAMQFLDIGTTRTRTATPSQLRRSVHQDRPGRLRQGRRLHWQHDHLPPQEAVGDFNYAVTLPASAAYRADQDKGDKSNYSVFSDGPYMLQGTWTKNKGGTFVRNPNWDPKTDTLRKAYPDKIVFDRGSDHEVIAQRLISDTGDDKIAVTRPSRPAGVPGQGRRDPEDAAGARRRRRSPTTSSRTSDSVTNPQVPSGARRGDRQGRLHHGQRWRHATVDPAHDADQPGVVGYKDLNAFSAPDTGDPAKAKQLLQQAGVPMPYPITVHLPAVVPRPATRRRRR